MTDPVVDGDAVRVLIHEVGRGLPGVRLLGEELLEDIDVRLQAGLPEECEAFLKRMRDDVQTILGYCDVHSMVIGNLRGTYAPDQQGIEQPTYVLLAPLLEDIVTQFDYIGQHSRNLRVKLLGIERCVCYGREGEIRRAIMNLIDNAIKYSFEGSHHGPERTVSVGASRWGEGAVITIQNFGVGILTSELDLVRQRGVRGTLAKLDRKPGSGLGLAEAERVALAYGGQLEIESRLADRDLTEEGFLAVLKNSPADAKSKPWVTTVSLRLGAQRRRS